MSERERERDIKLSSFSDGQDDENGVFSLPSLRRERERKPSIIYTKKRTIYTAGVCFTIKLSEHFITLIVTELHCIKH